MNAVTTVRGRANRALCDEVIERERASMGGFGPFERAWLHERAPEKVQRLLRLSRDHPHLLGAAPAITAPDGNGAGMPASATAVASTVTETNLWNPALWTPIGADVLRPGADYKIEGGGILSTTATPTVQWTPRYGQSATSTSNITLGTSTAVATGSGLASVPFYYSFTMHVRQLGVAAAGDTATGNGIVVLGGIAAAASLVFSIGGTVATTIDHTVAGGLCLSLTWGTSSASNTATCQWVGRVRSLT